MTTDNKKSDPNDWDDFFVCNNQNTSTAVELYASYKLFKERFDSLPKAALVQRGWINSKNDMASLTDFFKETHAAREGALFRRSDTASAALSSLWLSQIRSFAGVQIIANSVPEFNGLDKSDLKALARMSVDVDVIKRLPEILREKGIVLIYHRALQRTKVDGAVFKLASGNPVIGMSLRFSRLDNFWFTLLHELSHVNLHMDVLDNPILDDLDVDSDSEIEIAANRLAKSSFVDRAVWRNCPPKYDKGYEAIEQFANDIHIHKSIVAGMLRKEDGDYASYSRLVNEINAREVIFGND